MTNNVLFNTVKMQWKKSHREINEVKLIKKKGGGQNLERRNIKRPIFQNFKIANIMKSSWLKKKRGGQNLERRNVKRLIFRNFKIASIKNKISYSIILFLSFIFHFLEIVWTPKIFINIWSCEILQWQN